MTYKLKDFTITLKYRANLFNQCKNKGLGHEGPVSLRFLAPKRDPGSSRVFQSPRCLFSGMP